MLGNYVYI